MNKYELQARWLILTGKPIPVEIIPHVKVLDLNGTDVSDLTPLAGLTALEWLGIRSTKVADITPLSGLTELQGLWAGNTQVTDFSPISLVTYVFKY